MWKALRSRESRTPADTPHNQGICHHQAANPLAAQGPAGIFDLLSECSVVLCGGMGAGAANALLAHGIKPAMLPGERSAEDAVASYLSGDVPATPVGFCNCKH